MIAAMEIDSYWRTRSIGEAQGEGYTHLRATCPNCGRIADVPWPLLLGRKGTNRNTFLGNIPLKCQRCGNTNPAIGVRYQVSGNFRPLGPLFMPAASRSKATRCPSPEAAAQGRNGRAGEPPIKSVSSPSRGGNLDHGSHPGGAASPSTQHPQDRVTLMKPSG
jgi:hypothetical protein